MSLLSVLEPTLSATVPVDTPKASSSASESDEAGDADEYLRLCEADVKAEVKH